MTLYWMKCTECSKRTSGATWACFQAALPIALVSVCMIAKGRKFQLQIDIQRPLFANVYYQYFVGWIWSMGFLKSSTYIETFYNRYYNKTTRVWCAVWQYDWWRRITWARSAKVIFRHPKQSDIATQHTRQRLFCVYAILFI